MAKVFFPAAADFSTDLHSMGQYVQEGMRNLFETVVKIENPRHSISIPEQNEDLDGLEAIYKEKKLTSSIQKRSKVRCLLTQMVVCQT